MKGVSAGVKVGILFLLAIGGLYIVWKNLSTNPAGDRSYQLWAQFRDASGLPVGSKVVLAGLPVGEITGLSIEGRYARVTFRLRSDVKVWSSAVVYKKSTSLLGDYYLEIDPGSEIAQAPDGTQERYELLGDGDQVLHVVESTSVDQLLRRVAETMPDVDAVLAGVRDLTEDLRRVVNGPIASIATNVDALVQDQGKTVESILAKADRSMDRIDQITKDIRALTGGADERIDKILDNLDDASAEAKGLVTTARAEVEATGAKVREKLDLVDEVIASTDSIAKKIDEDRGTLGRLVNDPTIADNVEDITDDAKGFLGTLFNLQAYVGLRSEYNVFARGARHYVSVELHTRPDKFYLIEFERGPRGDYPDVSLELDPATGTWTRHAVIEDRLRFTFQFAKRFGWMTLRYGIKESTGGIGFDAEMPWWRGNDLKLSVDLFDATFDQLPRLKVAAALEVFRNIYVLAGADELLNNPSELVITPDPSGQVPIAFDSFYFGRDIFVGGMLRFNDEDLAALLAVGGSALSGLGN